MATPRAERLMNLHIMLLGSRRFVGKAAIRAALYPEHPDTVAGDDAFERAFERDKDVLRQIGAVIEVGSHDPLFDDEVGYRIPTEQSSLGEVHFTADEAAVLGLAARVWEDATLARATESALTKLKGLGVEIDPERLDVLPTSIQADEAGFAVLWDSIQRRRVVTFDYRRSGKTTVETRKVQPWGLFRFSGRWYAAGFDVGRGEERVFRLSRIQGAVRATGKQGAYEIPAGVDVGETARRLAPESARISVDVWVRQGTALGLRRRADETVEPDVAGPDGHGGWDIIKVTGPSHVVVDQIVSYAPDAVIKSPASIRAEVAGRLSTLLGEGA